jgi:hypothetical protein
MNDLGKMGISPRKLWLLFVGLSLLLPFHSKAGAEVERQKWRAAGFKDPEVRLIDIGKFYRSDETFTHGFDLTLVLLRGSGWTKKTVVRRLQKLARIYAPYRIKIGVAKLVIAGSPNGMIDFLRPGTGDIDIARRTPRTFRPIIYYIRSVPPLNAYSWIEHSDNEAVPDAIKNTAWISLTADMELNKKIRPPDYLTEAHELGHILLDSLRHCQPGAANLMAADYKQVSGRLEPHQVERIKRHQLVKRLPDLLEEK